MDAEAEAGRPHIDASSVPAVLQGKSNPNTSPVPTDASHRMSRQRRRDTKPEMLLRRELHRRGLRYRVDAQLPGLPRRRADVLFTRKKIAVFVDGCFWHACPRHTTIPKNNADWWKAKLEGNSARDRDTDLRLQEIGWTVLRFWEHEDMISAAESVEQHIRGIELGDNHAKSTHSGDWRPPGDRVQTDMRLISN
ncbi:very short patch repair endonuclease [Kocuria rosea]|uniref:very short patch repair endonuclease n=1 Tax=Kocuria rosea TaxID=1275 RepID=UPI000E0FD4A8|nr:very short patch repair endonuclease [Kocuria rosea]